MPRYRIPNLVAAQTGSPGGLGRARPPAAAAGADSELAAERLRDPARPARGAGQVTGTSGESRVTLNLKAAATEPRARSGHGPGWRRWLEPGDTEQTVSLCEPARARRRSALPPLRMSLPVAGSGPPAGPALAAPAPGHESGPPAGAGPQPGSVGCDLDVTRDRDFNEPSQCRIQVRRLRLVTRIENLTRDEPGPARAAPARARPGPGAAARGRPAGGSSVAVPPVSVGPCPADSLWHRHVAVTVTVS